MIFIKHCYLYSSRQVAMFNWKLSILTLCCITVCYGSKITCSDQEFCEESEICCLRHVNSSTAYECCTDSCNSVKCHISGKLGHVLISRSQVAENSTNCPGTNLLCKTPGHCVELQNGQSGCCSYENGILCQDNSHCCPSSHNCSDDSKKCFKNTTYLSSSLIHMKSVKENHVSSAKSKSLIVICPDGKSECEDGNTCCVLPSGSYGCCPYYHAICCRDHIHCCPQGYYCNISQSTCLRNGESVPMKKKLNASKTITSKNVEFVTCPDKKKQCPDKFTCCVLPLGDYGCCPIPDAVCCKDRIHCCPKGSRCNGSGCETSVKMMLTKMRLN